MSIPIFDRPFALSIGPQRAGTSWLDRYLRARGDVCMPMGVKEVFYFDRDFHRGIGHYASHFLPQPQHRLIMEVTTTAFDCASAPERVQSLFGRDARLICLLRHPVVRSYSLYLHYKRYGLVSGNLREAAAQNPQILESSHYATHLERWFSRFGRDTISILFQEDLERDQDRYVHSVCDVLGLPFLLPPPHVRDRFNVTTFSRSGLLAAWAQRSADVLRQQKLYGVINVAKMLGVKRLAFGTERPDAHKTSIPPQDRAWLEDQLFPHAEKAMSLIPQAERLWANVA